MAVINIENAQIKTASVEIKTLSVSGRQVTLSVFRQIIEESIIHEDTMKLNGTPWGLVNYFVKEDNPQCKINIVWQKGKELRRCVILKKAYQRNEFVEISTLKYSDLKYEINRGMKLIKQFLDEGRHYSWVPDEDIEKSESINKLKKAIDDLTNEINNMEQNISHFNQKNYQQKIDYRNKAIYRLNNLEEFVDDMEKKIISLRKECDEYSKEYDLLVKPLLDLPHLFIAI
jgi:hypothetical protein